MTGLAHFAIPHLDMAGRGSMIGYEQNCRH